jgi:hypothetical protein
MIWGKKSRELDGSVLLIPRLPSRGGGLKPSPSAPPSLSQRGLPISFHVWLSHPHADSLAQLRIVWIRMLAPPLDAPHGVV